MTEGPHAEPVLVCDGCDWLQFSRLLGQYWRCGYGKGGTIGEYDPAAYCRTPEWCPFVGKERRG